MRRIVAILLFACYLIPCLGLSVSTHYCGGKVTSVSVLSTKNTHCLCGKRAMKKGCCKDKVILVKTSQEQNIQKSIVYSSFKFSNFSVIKASIFKSPFLSSQLMGHILAWTDPPPGLSPGNLYLLNRVFRI